MTGGIASGKSTVSERLRRLGAVIVDADGIAREIVKQGKPAWQDIVEWLGPGVLSPGGGLDRSRLGDLVFRDAAARRKLESITHPRIREAALRALAEADRAGRPVAVIDVPLLFEAGWDKLADETWVVYVDPATQLDRLMKRDGLTAEQAKARIDAQMSLEEKTRLADVVIDNSKDPENTGRQVDEAWRQARAMAEQAGNGRHF